MSAPLSTAESGPGRTTPGGRDHPGHGPALASIAAPAVLLFGPVVAGLSLLVYRMQVRPAGLVLPYGLVLAVLGSVAYVVLAGQVSRVAGIAAAVGWVVGELATLVWHPGLDVLLAADWLGWAMMIVGTAGVMIAAGRGSPQWRGTQGTTGRR